MSTLIFSAIQNNLDDKSDTYDQIFMKKAFPIVCKNFDKILINPQMYFCTPAIFKVGLAFFGSVDIPLGIWITAWGNGYEVYKCENCSERALTTFSNGNPLTGSGSSQGYCSGCGKYWSRRIWSAGTFMYIKGLIENHKSELSSMKDRNIKPYNFKELVEILNQSKV